MKASVCSSSTRVLEALLASGANKEATDKKVISDRCCVKDCLGGQSIEQASDFAFEGRVSMHKGRS